MKSNGLQNGLWFLLIIITIMPALYYDGDKIEAINQRNLTEINAITSEASTELKCSVLNGVFGAKITSLGIQNRIGREHYIWTATVLRLPDFARTKEYRAMSTERNQGRLLRSLQRRFYREKSYRSATEERNFRIARFYSIVKEWITPLPPLAITKQSSISHTQPRYSAAQLSFSFTPEGDRQTRARFARKWRQTRLPKPPRADEWVINQTAEDRRGDDGSALTAKQKIAAVSCSRVCDREASRRRHERPGASTQNPPADAGGEEARAEAEDCDSDIEGEVGGVVELLEELGGVAHEHVLEEDEDGFEADCGGYRGSRSGEV